MVADDPWETDRMVRGVGEPEAPAWRLRLGRRRAPLFATAATVVLGMNWTVWWDVLVHHEPGVWAAPADQWGTVLAALHLVHGHFNGIYTQSTGLVTFPGYVFLLAPAAAVFSALHLELGPQLAAYAAPTGWVLTGPFELLTSSVALFGADAVAERLGVTGWRRHALALAGAAVLAEVTLGWGHPEDAVAVGLVLYAALEADRARWRRAAWLLGAAVAVQPLAVLAVGALVARAGRRQLASMALPLVLPSAAVLVGPLIASWHAAVHVLVDQPNYPDLNHPTPWTSLLPRLHERFVAVPAGPGRAIATVAALAAGYVVCRRRPDVATMLWMVGLAFFLRVVAESVLDAYYQWPVLAIGLVLAAGLPRWRWWATAAVALFVTWFSNVHLGGMWAWWSITVLALAATLALSWPGRAAAVARRPRIETGRDLPTPATPAGVAGATDRLVGTVAGTGSLPAMTATTWSADTPPGQTGRGGP